MMDDETYIGAGEAIELLAQVILQIMLLMMVISPQTAIKVEVDALLAQRPGTTTRSGHESFIGALTERVVPALTSNPHNCSKRYLTN